MAARNRSYILARINDKMNVNDTRTYYLPAVVDALEQAGRYTFSHLQDPQRRF